MDNLFPDFHTFSIDDASEAPGRGGAVSWDPVSTYDRRSRGAALPGGRPPRRKKLEKEPPPLPRPAPNDRDSGFVLAEDSPLCEAQRGVPDPTQIVAPKVAKEKRRQTKQEELNELRVILNIHNRTPVSHEIFSHSQTTVHSIELKEKEDCLRLAGNLKPQSQSEVPESNVLPVLLSTPVIATVNMSARQEIKAFHFNPGPIGMVVELKGNRLMCTKVMPNSQCSFHEQAMVGSEIIAVNGNRVLTLQSFVEAIGQAQQYTGQFIDITVSAFRGGRMKLDEMLSFSKKNKKMTSLLGNMFTKGIDKDHSHGIELPAAAETSSDENESEVAEEEAEAVFGEDFCEAGDADPAVGTEATADDSPPAAAATPATDDSAALAEDQPESVNNAADVHSSGSSRRHTRLKGPLLDDNSSMGSSSKKKFMAVYRGDSDDESAGSLNQLGDLSVDATENSSMDDEEGEPEIIVQKNSEELEEKIDAPIVSAQSGEIDLNKAASRVEDEYDATTMEIEVEQQTMEVHGEIAEKTDEVSDDDDDDDDGEVNEELAAKIRQHGIVDALEEIATGEEVPIVLEEEEVENESDEESEPGDVWDYATVLEGQDYSPYRCLVCMPQALEKSANGWGNPQSFLHFANFSTEWYLEVFWVDHESLLVPRVKLRSGERHNEMTSPDLVWCIIATYVEKKHRRRRDVPDDDAESIGGDSNAMIPGKSNVVMLFKTISAHLQY